MKPWKSTFQRPDSGWRRLFCPVLAEDRLEDVNLEALWSSGKRLLLLDVDKTLVEWRQEEISGAVLGWIESARGMGFQFRILSNTRHPERLHRIAGRLGIIASAGRMKPSRDMYLQALRETDVPAEQAVMIGDQLMTDILGASRCGIDAIWLAGMPGPEFIGTKFNRMLEAAISKFLEPLRTRLTD